MVDWSSMWKKEDWWALWIGLLIFILALVSAFPLVPLNQVPAKARTFLLGWVPDIKVWTDISKALAPVSAGYGVFKDIQGFLALFLLYLFLLFILTLATRLIGVNSKQFVIGFTFIFWLAYACWIIGNWAYIAATNPSQYHLSWSLRLTGEVGYIIALAVGLLIGNLVPKLPKWLEAAAKPELYIKTGIVILGALIGAKTAQSVGMASTILTKGVVAAIVAYLIFWPVAYLVSRKLGLDRDFSAVLASGVGVCGVSAAMATAAAIRTRSTYSTLVSSIIVLFAALELIVLPFTAASILSNVPFAGASWLALSVKTDGAASASGAVLDALVSQKVQSLSGWILATTVTIKVLIDTWIGITAFILAIIWTYRIEKRPNERISPLEIWFRFPKFVIGYFLTWLVLYPIGVATLISTGSVGSSAADLVVAQTEAFRKVFFLLTFMSIGLATNFKKFAEIKAERAVLAYAISLLLIIIIGLAISYILFAPLGTGEGILIKK